MSRTDSVAPDVRALLESVVDNGCCIGCGLCAVVRPGEIEVAMDSGGLYQAKTRPVQALAPNAPDPGSVCPFSDNALNEDQIAQKLFGDHAAPDTHLGNHLACYAGHVADQDFRARGSSGGMGTWILAELLERKAVDAILHVRPNPANNGGPLFSYGISRTAEEVRAGAKSRYYPVELSAVLKQIEGSTETFAVVGLPCFIKGLRLLCETHPEWSHRLKFFVSIFCGHLKSARYADYLAWQCGVAPGTPFTIDFRHKQESYPASDYAVAVTPASGPAPKPRAMRTLYGANWGYGFFKYPACDFCDDVVGETADISLGDAWLPEFVGDSAGTNVVIVRNPALHYIVKEAKEKGRLHLEPLDRSKVVESQAGGFRHRRDGLAYRLHLRRRAGQWAPRKRVEPSESHLDAHQKLIYEQRLGLAKASHEAFADALESRDFGTFVRRIDPLVARYDSLYIRPAWRRFVFRAKRLVKQLLGRSIAAPR